MDRVYPIYTVETECQDCYKCVRHCPVKAIKVSDGHAAVIPELCTACGHCVQICPAKAKKVRDDSGRVKHLLKEKKVYVSLAPSWVSEFREVSRAQMTAILKKLGFTGVSETALGAQEVSAFLADFLREAPAGIYMSSACPAAVEYVAKYYPKHTKDITGLISPVLAHAKLLKQEFGKDAAVVMIGPCIAKKRESDEHGDLLDLVISFDDLRAWMLAEGLNFSDFKEEKDDFILGTAEEGAVYPIEGGMFDTIKAYKGLEDIKGITLTGLKSIGAAFDELEGKKADDVIFIEALACSGGCVNGPCTTNQGAGLLGRLNVLKNAPFPDKKLNRIPSVEVTNKYDSEKLKLKEPDEELIRKALRSIGKVHLKDELNCGGCGYESCRNFAKALISARAEQAMCVSYLRNQAQKKANALLRCMPSGVVIVNADMQIIECNERFANMFDEHTKSAYEALPGLKGAMLEKIVPFKELFQKALMTGKDIKRESFHFNDRLLDISVFSIEAHQTIGAVLADVTETESRREQIASKAKEVINRNLATVQEIACRLGEHMADTEILLRSIAEDYADDGKSKKNSGE